ncbi:MAG: type II toxin-antitoxin system PemK/MazF family toxin [Salinibacter sp.]
MAGTVKGDVVVVPFPFSSLEQSKRRPALVLAELEGEDRILCQITSQRTRDRHAIPLNDDDFASVSLRQPSNIRPNRLFTADQRIVLYRAGHLQRTKLDEAMQRLIDILQS